MIAYASRTGTRRNLAGLRANGWRLMLSPAGCLRTEGFPYALDNGAFSAWQGKKPWDEKRFLHALQKFGDDADFVIVPDVVCDARATLELFDDWIWPVQDWTSRAMIAVQNGMTADDVACRLTEHIGIFVGGDSAWKDSTIPMWSNLAREYKTTCHVGRVNTLDRLRICQLANVTSFDGSGASRFDVHRRRMDRWRNEPALPLLARVVAPDLARRRVGV